MAGLNVIKHELLGKVSEPYLDAREIAISIQHDPEDPHAIPIVALSDTDWIFEESNAIQKHMDDFGIHSGVAYKQTVSDDDNSIVLVDGFLDPSSENAIFGCDTVENIPVILRGRNDWATDAAKAVMFNVLLAQGKITTDQYVQVPYVINTIPNYTEAAIATISAFVVIQKIIDISKEIGKVVAGILSVLGAIGAILKLLIVIAWVIVILGLIILFLMDIADHIIQPVKYHASMKLRDLLDAGCKELGLEFRSSIFDDDDINDSVYMPAKLQSFKDVNNANSLGFTIPDTRSNGYYKDSFFELLLFVKKLFNAKIIISDDDELILERVDTSTNSAELRLPNLPLKKNGNNGSETIASYTVEFREDLSDHNTIDNYEGTLTQATTTTTSGVDKKIVSIKGEKTIDLGVSRASRKGGLNNIEQRLNLLYTTHSEQVNQVADIANGLTRITSKIITTISKLIKKLKVVGIKINFDPQPIPRLMHITPTSISERIGMMMLSTDFFQEDKVISLDIATNPFNTKLKEDNDLIWHSETIYNKFHVVQSHAPTTEFPFGNQYVRYSLPDFPLCLEDVIKAINNNIIFTHDGRTAKIESLEWRPFTGIATNVKIRILEVSDRFLVTNLITEDGN
jgi:hypothetical protein